MVSKQKNANICFQIDKWVRDISDLHRSKPNPSVHYTKPMPDLDDLMQVIYLYVIQYFHICLS